MSEIRIPPEALEAGARAICETENGPCECLPDECGCTYWQAHARASFLAMIEAWPKSMWDHARSNGSALILPIPKGLDFIDPLTAQENPDDKA